MIIVIEGADMVGKTVLAERLCKEFSAEYLHMTYRFAGHEFAYHTAVLMMALNKVKKGSIVVLDRCWISEAIYAKVYREQSPVPLMGRWMDRIIQKVGGCYIFCLHKNLKDYKKRYLELRDSRDEMYKEPTIEVARHYKEAWNGTWIGSDYIESIAGGFKGRCDTAKYIIEEDPDHSSIVKEVRALLDTNKQSWIDCDNIIGNYSSSKFLLVGDEVNETRKKKGRCMWPFHRPYNSGEYLTEWLNFHKVKENDLSFVNIHGNCGLRIIESWVKEHPDGRVIVFGLNAMTTMTKELPRLKIYRVHHPQAAARFPQYRKDFNTNLRRALQC